MLEIKNFSKFYGDKKVVDNLSISVQSGDIYGFIGANGAGKTTMIKAVVGIHDFENGSITINGHSKSSFSTKESDARMRVRWRSYFLFNTCFGCCRKIM